jgi:hypothetical protein
VGRTIVRFCSVVFVALALAPSLAHLLELPHKIRMSRDAYFTVQQIYRGWSLLGIVIFLALAATLLLTIVSRGNRRAFLWALVAFVAVAATQGVFWAFTFPTNRATDNWTSRPADWEALRTRWEYSHAAGAGLNLVALAAVTIAALESARQEATRMEGGAGNRQEPAGAGADVNRNSHPWPRNEEGQPQAAGLRRLK